MIASLQLVKVLLGFGILARVVNCADAVTCGDGKQCPEDQPCCSQYGECGTGLYCLGACDVRHSFNLTSCVPLPKCESKTYEFKDKNDIVDQSKYLGDASKYGWTTNGKVVSSNDSVLLTMAKNSYGTVLSSTHAVWYGKVSATLQTSHGDGVVSAFILMSGAKDEIDYEFVGSDVGQVQTNFYWQGALNYSNSDRAGLSNTNESFHTYAFDWSPDKIDWMIDDQVVRTLNKADTYNDTSQTYMFPQTPSIVQLSLWPGGSDKNPEGTVEWAGGSIDWNMPEFSDPGYLSATLKEITVDCYDPPSDADVQGDKSYSYKGDSLLESDVQITDDDYVLKSPQGCGFNMNKGSDDDLAKVSQQVPTKLGGNDAKMTTYLAVSALSDSSSSESLFQITGKMSSSTKKDSQTTKTSNSNSRATGASDGSNNSHGNGNNDSDSDSNSGQGSQATAAMASTGSSSSGSATQSVQGSANVAGRFGLSDLKMAAMTLGLTAAVALLI